METNVCIKGVEKAVWLDLKSEAVKSGKSIGGFIEILMKKYVTENDSNWDEILYRKPVFTKEEIDEMRATAENLRKEMSFR